MGQVEAQLGTTGARRLWRTAPLALATLVLVGHCALSSAAPGNGLLEAPAFLLIILVGPVAALTWLALPIVVGLELMAGRYRLVLLLLALTLAGLPVFFIEFSLPRMVLVDLPDLFGASHTPLSLVLVLVVAGGAMHLTGLSLSMASGFYRAVTGGLLLIILAGSSGWYLSVRPPSRVSFYLEQFEPVSAALHAYDTDHGAPPDELQQLVPDYLPELPPRAAGAFWPGGPGQLTYQGDPKTRRFWLEMQYWSWFPGPEQELSYDSDRGSWFRGED